MEPTTTSGRSTGGAAAGGGERVEVDCSEAPAVESPAWAAKADSPRPSRADFTGSWLALYNPDSYPAGIVKWQRSCYGGHNMLILQQNGSSVSSTWSSSDGVGGALPEYSYYRGEQTLGARDGDELTLVGVRTDRRVSTMGGGDEVTCTALRYELTFVPKTKRLVGTVNGEPIEFAPAVIDETPPQDCGDPPP